MANEINLRVASKMTHLGSTKASTKMTPRKKMLTVKKTRSNNLSTTMKIKRTSTMNTKK